MQQPLSRYKFYMVFDVESVGLHGNGFAVGYVVIDPDGKELEAGVFCCPMDNVTGTAKNLAWVMENVPNIEPTHDTTFGPFGVRSAFWNVWRRWADAGAALVADCAWPVEARFLCACVEDAPAEREWKGPYPLIDLGSVFFAAGMDPLATYPRLENELPIHHPLADARQSARLLIDVLCEKATPAKE